MNHINRRRVPRRVPQKSAKVICFADSSGAGPDLAVALLDVSAGGIQLVVGEPLQVGDVVRVGLQGSVAARPRLFQGRVMWCVALADGRYAAGAVFLKPLGSATLRAFARPPASGPSASTVSMRAEASIP